MTGQCVCTDGLMYVHKCPGVEYVRRYTHVHMYPGVYINMHVVWFSMCVWICVLVITPLRGSTSS